MTIRTFSDRSNASRAAKKAAIANGIKDPQPGEHYRINTLKGEGLGPEFSFTLLGRMALVEAGGKPVVEGKPS